MREILQICWQFISTYTCESHDFQLPWQIVKVEHVKKVCGRVDHTGSAILRKPDSGRPATASAYTVCRCKTIFPLVGPIKLYNNVSKNVNSKKSDSYRFFYNYRTLRHAMTKKWRHFHKAAFSLSGRKLKTWQSENDGYSWKINAIWWNIKINL